MHLVAHLVEIETKLRKDGVIQLPDKELEATGLHEGTNGAVMVENGLAYSVVIEGFVSFWDYTKITCRPLSPELTATCVLAWKRQQPFSLAATKFIEHTLMLFRHE